MRRRVQSCIKFCWVFDMHVKRRINDIRRLQSAPTQRNYCPSSVLAQPALFELPASCMNHLVSRPQCHGISICNQRQCVMNGKAFQRDLLHMNEVPQLVMQHLMHDVSLILTCMCFPVLDKFQPPDVIISFVLIDRLQSHPFRHHKLIIIL